MGFEQEFLRWMMDVAQRYGYLGAFLASLLGNASIILPAPYALFIFTLGALMDPADLPLLAIVSGTGAAIGELTGYALGAAWRKTLEEERRKKLEKAKKLLEKPAFLVVLLMAATPLPDDVVSLPLGLIGYPLWKAFPAFLIGKIALCFLLAYSGKGALTAILMAFEAGGLWGMVGTGVAMLVVAIIIVLMDWDVMLEVVEERGWRGLFSLTLMKRLLLSVVHRFRSKKGEEKAPEAEEAAEEAEEGEAAEEGEKAAEEGKAEGEEEGEREAPAEGQGPEAPRRS